MQPNPLTAPEALVLLNPNQEQSRTALKLAMTELLARRLMSMRSEEEKGFLGFKQKTDFIQLAPTATQKLADLPVLQVISATLDKVGEVSREVSMAQFIQQAYKDFGYDFSSFQAKHILPALVEKGLLEPRQEKMLLLFRVTRYDYTPAGEALKQQLDDQMAQARTVPVWLDSEPAQATALLISLGSAVLLIDELRAHYARLSQTLPAYSLGDGSLVYFGGDVDGSALDGSDQENATMPELPELGNIFNLNFDFDLGLLDSAMDSLSGSFDAATGGGDGGSGGGGGGGD